MKGREIIIWNGKSKLKKEKQGIHTGEEVVTEMKDFAKELWIMDARFLVVIEEHNKIIKEKN